MDIHRLALPKGFRLANYELIRVLGKGGFGITYLGIDRHLGRKVAVKELMPDTIVTRVDGKTVVSQSEALAANWNWAKERFLEEARALAGFQHPNIVEIHQLIEANGTVYIVMDYIEGESYEARLRRIGTEPDERSMRQFLEPLLDGLEEVHNANLLHRDIKPDNVLLRRGTHPILVDFGSARKVLEGTAVMTSLVTHGYSPIEQYQVKGKQGPWTDIYALGAVVVRAITGEKPPMSADRMSEDDFMWLSYRGLKGFTPLFLQAVDWALRTKPKDRPQAISEWRASFGWKTSARIKQSPPKGETNTTLALGVEIKPATEKPPLSLPATEPKPAEPRRIVVQPKTQQLPVSAPEKPAEPAESPKSKPPVFQWKKTLWRPVLVGASLLFILIIIGLVLSSHSKKSSNASPAGDKGSVGVVNPSAARPAKSQNYVVFENSLGMKFAPVPGTDVLFCIWDTRLKDYEEFVKATGREWRKPDYAQEPDHPAVNVSWNDAKDFCRWLTAKEGRTYRLPTDEEWSLAAGLPPEAGATPSEKDGKIKNVYAWEGGWPPSRGTGNFARSLMLDDYDRTSPVGAFPENRFGLYDMSGNVWQWCEDWYDSLHRKKVLRGGAWNTCLPEMLLCSFRYYSLAGDQYDNIGFRCVTPASEAKKP